MVTAVRNGAALLPETISSIRAQTLDDWEHVVVDDASEDDTAAIVERAASDDPRIRLLRRGERGGPYVAANDGLHQARGRYVARIDADDVAAPERLERQLAYLRSTGLRACACWWQGVTVEGATAGEVRRVDDEPDVLPWRLCLRQGLAHSTAFFERDALLELGGYRPLFMSQDLWMWCEFARRRWLGVVPEMLVGVRRPGRMTGEGADRQESLALDVLREHVIALTGQEWSLDEVRALRPGGRDADLGSQRASLTRWEQVWRRDDGLSQDGRRALSRLAREARWELAKRGLTRQPASVETLRSLIALARSLVGAS